MSYGEDCIKQAEAASRPQACRFNCTPFTYNINCDIHRPIWESRFKEQNMEDSFTIKDSGARQSFESGMVRDTQDNKSDFTRVLDGPMFDRWATHLTKGEVKYPDVKPGVPNWTLANGEAELIRFKKSAFRHFRQWMRGDKDEDHAAAVFFNINGAEYVKTRLG